MYHKSQINMNAKLPKFATFRFPQLNSLHIFSLNTVKILNERTVT